MDENLRAVLDEGRRAFKLVKNNPYLPLDNSDNSILNLQVVIEALREAKLPQKNKDYTLIGAAIYIAEIFIRRYPPMEFKVLFDRDKLWEIQLIKGERLTLDILSWVIQCYENSSKFNLNSAYQQANLYIKKYLK